MTESQKSFINKIGALAMADMKRTGVLASLTIAQAILESDWGKSGLTVTGKALFGIKATTSWKGKVYVASTKECYDGVSMTTVNNASFRAYDSWEDSVADHSKLFTSMDRYKNLLGVKDYKLACQLVKDCGYATDPQYTSKLIHIVESFRLTAYDNVSSVAAASISNEAETVKQAGRPVLRQGSKGEPVKELQRLLNSKINSGLSVDGDFGKLTDTAVRKFQTVKKLGVDGIVGQVTWGELLK